MVRSHSIDSLDRLIGKSGGVKKTELLAVKYKTLGDTATARNKYDSAIIYLIRAVDYAEQTSDVMLLARCYNNLALAYSKKGLYPESFVKYDKALDIVREFGDSEELAALTYNIGIAYKDQGIRDKALDLLFESERLSGALKNQKRLSGIYNASGNLYKDLYLLNHDMDNLHKALAYHFMAYRIRITLNEEKGLSSSYNNLGTVYKLLEKDDSALFYYQRSLELKNHKGDRKGIANTYSNMGEIYLKTGNAAEAETYFKKAYEIRVKDSLQEGIVYSMIDFGRLNLYNKNYRPAISVMLQGEQLARRIKAHKQEAEIYKLLKDAYRAMHNFPKAIEYYDRYVEALDTFNNIEMRKQIERLSISYETEKKEQQIESLNQQAKITETTIRLQNESLKFQNMVNISLIIGSVILVLLLIISVYAYLLKRKASAQKEMHMRELHHRVKNNLQILSGLLTLQSDQLTDPLAKEAVKSGENRVKAMALIHQRLYNETEVTRVNMKEYITDLVSYLTDAYGFSEAMLSVRYDLDPEDLDVDKAIPIGLILNELVSNAFKYAFAGHPDPQLFLSFHKNKEDRLQLIVRDNGTKQPAATRTDSFGLKLVRSLCRQLKAQMQVTTDNGFSYTLTI